MARTGGARVRDGAVDVDVVLHGQKLRGGFTLVRAGARAAPPAGPERWFLIKRRDEYADPAWDLERPELNRSAVTGRTLQEIAAGQPSERGRR